MTRRKIIIHAGFHKTGTTNLQKTLKANRAALHPDIRLVLRPGMKALCESARAYSASREDYDLGLVKYEAALLIESLQDESAGTIIISSEDLSGHMPGRHGLHGYGATPHLMRALLFAFRSAAPEDAITFFFTTRAADPWLRSCYAQHLRTTRMIWSDTAYLKRFKASADLDKVIDLVKREVQQSTVVVAALEDHADRHLGIADALLDHLNFNAERRVALTPSTLRNSALPRDVLQQLLALNRSDLPAPALKVAKRALTQRIT